MAGKHPNRVEYPYADVKPVNRELTGYNSLTLDQQQALFDKANGVPTRDERLAERVLAQKSCGVVGGLVVKDAPCLYVSKNNYNPPTSNLQMVNESLLGSGLPKDYEYSPPVPITLPLLRLWAAANKPPDPSWDSERLNTPPDCTVGVLRSRETGRLVSWIPCNSWSCSTCGPIKRDRLRAKVVEAFGDQPTYFLTLNSRVPRGKQKYTDSNPMMSDGYHISGYLPQEELPAAFQRFRSILNKRGYFTGATGDIVRETHYVNKFGTPCVRTTRARTPYDQAYFYVKEFSPPSHVKNGRVTVGHRRHYHLLMNFDIPEDIIRHAWWLATNKTSTNIKMVSETDEFGKLRPSYITKYINKSMSDDTFIADYLPYERRYGKSVGFFTMAYPSLGRCFFQPLVASTRAYDEAIHEPDKLPEHFSRQHPLA